MIALTWWQLAMLVFGINLASAISAEIRATITHYRHTCPGKRTLPRTGLEVRCSKTLTDRECPDHGRVR